MDFVGVTPKETSKTPRYLAVALSDPKPDLTMYTYIHKHIYVYIHIQIYI